MVARRWRWLLVVCVLSMGAAAPAGVPGGAPGGGAGGGAAVPLVVALAAFKPINADAASAWVGEGVRRGIELQLRRGAEKAGSALVVRDLPADVVEADPAMAAAVGLRADVIVVGSYQVAGNEVRATGRVMSVSTGREIAFVSARSPLRTIFDLQDELGYQVRRALLPETGDAVPGPGFDGSALDRSLDGTAPPPDGRAPRADRNPRNPPPPAGPVSRENPGGWGGPGNPGATAGGGSSGGGGYTGGGSYGGGYGGSYGGWGGWGPYVPYVPIYYPPATPPVAPPANPPGGGGGGGGNAGGSNAGGDTTAPPPASTPPPRRPIYNPRDPDTRIPPPNP